MNTLMDTLLVSLQLPWLIESTVTSSRVPSYLNVSVCDAVGGWDLETSCHILPRDMCVDFACVLS